MNKKQVLDYIQLRASGVGQAPGYSYKHFYYEMLDLVKKERERDGVEVSMKTVRKVKVRNKSFLIRWFPLVSVSNSKTMDKIIGYFTIYQLIPMVGFGYYKDLVWVDALEENLRVHNIVLLCLRISIFC